MPVVRFRGCFQPYDHWWGVPMLGKMVRDHGLCKANSGHIGGGRFQTGGMADLNLDDARVYLVICYEDHVLGHMSLGFA